MRSSVPLARFRHVRFLVPFYMSTRTESLANRAYALVEEMIVTLELSPGAVVSESELSRHIDIGRTPLREALQRLAEDRLVNILPRRGIMVTEINLRDHLALLETRRVLDRLIGTRAARRAEPSDRLALEACAAAMHEAADADELGAFMRLDHEFDQIVTAAARNPFAADAAAPLHAHCRRFWYRFKADGDLKRSAQLHERSMRAIAAGNEEQAAEASDTLAEYLKAFARATLDVV